jgi:tetratricopeptide (TPR) repeat protein
MENFPLPNREAAIPPSQTPPLEDALGENVPGQGGGLEGLDFSDFLGTGPGALSPPGLNIPGDLPEETALPGEEDDYGLPRGLLNGLADDLESGPAGGEDFLGAEPGELSLDSLDLPDVPEFPDLPVPDFEGLDGFGEVPGGGDRGRTAGGPDDLGEAAGPEEELSLDNLDLPDFDLDGAVPGDGPAEAATGGPDDPGEAAGPGEELSLDNLDLPDVDLDGAVPGEGPAEAAESGPADPAGAAGSEENFFPDSLDFPDLDLGETVPGGDLAAAAGSSDDLAGEAGPGEELSLDSLDLPDLDETVPGGGPAEAMEGGSGDLALEGEAPAGELPDFSGMDDGDGSSGPAEGLELSGGEGEFSFPGEAAGEEGPAASPEGADPFAGFDPGSDTTPAAGSGDGSAGEGMEDFSLEGFDEILKKALPPEPKTPAGGGFATADSGITPSGDVEEILLSEGDVEKLRATLASYPLNLRIICEELIAEQAVVPDLMSRLIKLLVQGAPARETASLAGKILGRPVAIPRGFEKKTGAELEAEQSTFAYIFVHNFLPVFRLFLLIGLVALSLFYLIWKFIYIPLKADAMYKLGYERIGAGEYGRANERFREAAAVHRVKKWFYRYAEAFRDERQYILAEEKYDELLRYYPRDKKGVLDYAAMETYYQGYYEKADRLLRRELLDFSINDREGLLALGDNNLAWGEEDPSRYEEAREAYARLMERYGRTDPVLERMLKYFIRTDKLLEVLSLQAHFMGAEKREIAPSTLAEMGGYLLDKRFEDSQGVPHEFQARIEGIRDILLRAIRADPSYPESYYHLARYYNHWGNLPDERITLEEAIKSFDAAQEETVRRLRYRIDTQGRYAQLLINNREFIEAERELVRGIGFYEDALNRGRLSRTPEFGRLYADLGDLEYFTKEGNMESALQYYGRAETNGWAPPEMQYRMGSAYYHLGQWAPALERFFAVSSELPLNRRILHTLGNVSFLRGNYYAAQGYYGRLLDELEAERIRFPLLSPQEQPEHMELVKRLMAAQNNLAVTLNVLSGRTGNPSYRSRALGLFNESSRAWDSLTRNPETMIRRRVVVDPAAPVASLPYLNSQKLLSPEQGYDPQIFVPIDKDVLEPSAWENLAPPGIRLSDAITLSTDMGGTP